MGRQRTYRLVTWARRRALPFALAPAVVAGFVGLSASPAAAAAAITLTPSSGTAGSNFSISGSGFAASEHIKFTWDAANGTEIAVQVDANLSGQFSNVQATAPQGSPAGAHTVFATGTGAVPNQATSTYTVNPPPGGGTTTTTRATTTTTRPPQTTTTTRASGGGGGGGTSPTTTTTVHQGGGGSPANVTASTTPSGGSSVGVGADTGVVATDVHTDVLGESLNDGTTTTTSGDGKYEDALGKPFPAIHSTGGGCTACWAAVAVLLGGVGVVGVMHQRKSRRRRSRSRNRRRRY